MFSDAIPDGRILCWFSCGATSAVATKIMRQGTTELPWPTSRSWWRGCEWRSITRSRIVEQLMRFTLATPTHMGRCPNGQMPEWVERAEKALAQLEAYRKEG